MRDSAHLAQFFDSNEKLLDALCKFVVEAANVDATGLLLVTPEHQRALQDCLRLAGHDPDALIASYRLIVVDAHVTLAKTMHRHRVDQYRFHDILGTLITQASARGQPVRIFSEFAALLIQDGHESAIVKLEDLWNELSRHQVFAVTCAFPAGFFARDHRRRTLDHVCARHTKVLDSKP
ncbi:MAG TPA: MEDS domain-containing protein [Steroidobacteraceae bacterium]|nr:MEDS domain-containing protein [Steroidobacteraceae bacterium]